MRLDTALRSPVVGLDIGTSAVKAVALRRGKGKEEWSLVAAGETAIPDGSIAGGVPEARVVRDAVSGLLDSLQLRRARVAAALAGNSVIVKRLAFPEMSEEALTEAIPWEAEQYIPFDLGEVTLDYQIVKPEKDASTSTIDVLLVAAKREHIETRAGMIAQTGRRPVVLDIEAFALANAYQMNYPERTDPLAVLVHVGRSLTVVCLLERGEPGFTRDIPIGGQAHLDVIKCELGAKGLDQRRAKAIVGGQSSADLNRDRVASLLRQATGHLVLEVRKTVDFYRTTAPVDRLSRIILSGGAYQAMGLAELLGSELGAPVEVFDPFRRVSRSGQEIGAEASGPAYAVAVGLAMRQEGDR